MKCTTLMIRNITTKFMKNDLLKLIDANYYGKYDYFYLPIDLQTQCSIGFAFLNMTHPLFILDFYLEFNYFKWQDLYPDCKSTKCCEIVYANMQGMDQIKEELKDKNIMKKHDRNIKPIIMDNVIVNKQQLDEIKHRFT